MKNKNGFIFIETIVVLTVTMVSLLTLYNSYVLVLKSAEQKKYYNNINDVYKANIVKNLLKLPNKNYKIADSKHYEVYTKENCNTIMENDCSLVIENMDIDYVVFVDNKFNEINYGSDTTLFKNTFKKYISSLDAGNGTIGHLIIIREDDKHKRYYASIMFGTYNSGGEQ